MRFENSLSVPGTSSEELKLSRRARVLWTLAPVGVFFVVMLCGAYALKSAFGSVPTAIGYLRGDRLFLDPAEILVERPKQGSTVVAGVVVSNFSDSPVNLLGANVSCSCVVTGSLPAKVGPGETIRLPITVNISPDKIVDETVILFTDHPNHAQLVVRVKAVSNQYHHDGGG